MFKLGEYLKYIGLPNFKAEPTLETLTKITWHHLQSTKYQNIELFTEGRKNIENRGVKSVELAHVFQRLVENDKPGFCFQNAELLYAALTRLGFKVTRHVATVFNKSIKDIDWNQVDQMTPDHEVLFVNIDGHDYLVDTGLANNSLRGPLLIQLGEVSLTNDDSLGQQNKILPDKQRLDQDRYRISKRNCNLALEMFIGKGWLCLYQFCPTPCSLEKILMANDQLFKSPKMIVIRDEILKFACVTPRKRRFVLYDTREHTFLYKSFKPNGIKVRKLNDVQEACALINKKLGIEISEETLADTVSLTQ